MFELLMTSEDYGTETFEYDTREEAEAGRARIEAKSAELNDGVERFFAINEV